jgi:hypothetical protein
MWKARYGVSYVPSPAECKQLQALIQRAGAEMADWPRVVARYLEDPKWFVAHEMRHSLMYLCTRGFNTYRAAAPAVVSEREAMSHEASRQFVNGEGGDHGRPR